MKEIQLIQVTPESLQQLISKVVEEHLQEIKTLLNSKPLNDWLSRKETAKLLKINLSTLSVWTKNNLLLPYGLGGRVYYKRSEVEQAIIKLQ
jgi:hypothetical protein